MVDVTRSPYGYAGGNPINEADPSGLRILDPDSGKADSSAPRDAVGTTNLNAGPSDVANYGDTNAPRAMDGTRAKVLPDDGPYPYVSGAKGGAPKKLPGNQGFKDKYNNKWKWDPIKQEWDVTHQDGSHTKSRA